MLLFRATRRPLRGAMTLIMLVALLATRPLTVEAQEAPADLVLGGAGVGLRGVRYQAPDEPLPSILPAVAALVVENPNDGFAAEGVRLALSVYGATDQRIGDVTFDVPQVLPRERRGLAAELTIQQSRLPVVRVEAALVSVTRWVPVRAVPLLEVSRVMAVPSFHADLAGGGAVALPYAVGMVANPLDAAVGEVPIVAIVYDQAGAVVGGSLRHLPYVAPLGTAVAGSGTLIYGTDIESRSLIGASWGRVELLAAYPWIDLTPYRR